MNGFFVAFVFLLAAIILAVIGTVLFWELKRKRNADKTYTYHVKVTLNSGRVVRLTLDEALYDQFNGLLQQEEGRFCISAPSKSDQKIPDMATTLHIKYIAAVTMRRW